MHLLFSQHIVYLYCRTIPTQIVSLQIQGAFKGLHYLFTIICINTRTVENQSLKDSWLHTTEYRAGLSKKGTSFADVQNPQELRAHSSQALNFTMVSGQSFSKDC